MSALYRHRFKLLLVSLLGVILIVPVVLDLVPGRSRDAAVLVVLVVSAFALAAGTVVVGGRRWALVLALCLLVPSLLVEVVLAAEWRSDLAVCHHLLRLLFLGFVIVEVLRQLFQPEPVTFDTISASLCVYLLLGLVWMHVYVMMDTLVPGSIITVVRLPPGLARASGEPALSLRMLYFSLATLTSVGYGDIVPATTSARMLATTEAIVGQAYLYVMVARLVGMQVSQAFAPTAPAPRPDGEPDAAPTTRSPRPGGKEEV
jgi:hypothetical protein